MVYVQCNGMTAPLMLVSEVLSTNPVNSLENICNWLAMLWLNSIIGSNYIFLYFKPIIIHGIIIIVLYKKKTPKE